MSEEDCMQYILQHNLYYPVSKLRVAEETQKFKLRLNKD